MAQYTETCGLQPTRSNPSRKQPGTSSSTWTIVRRSMNTGQDEEPPTSPGGREETRRSSAFSEDEPKKQPLKTEQPSEIQADGTRLKLEDVTTLVKGRKRVEESDQEAIETRKKERGSRIWDKPRRFNLRVFKSIVFLEYETPVNGSKPDECDVSWRFRNKKEKSWRRYRDFRRFKFAFGENCTYEVFHTSGWHSGVNARRFRIKPRGGGGGGPKAPRGAGRDPEINDTIPTLGSQTNFRRGKYLYYSRGGDYCKGMNQYMWSFLCGLGEAMYLNRTFVMDLSLCLSSSYSSKGVDEEGKDFRYYFDFEHLKESASIVEEGEFVRDWKKWNRSHKRKVAVRKVKTHKVSPLQLSKDKSTIIWRQFDAPEPENYWYRVCEGEASKYVERPWQTLWKSKRLMNIVSEISGKMDWDFDAVHVVRGEKAMDKKLWPHLDEDTWPDAILNKLRGLVQPWRNLYVATNEPFYNYFDKLRSQYKVHLLDDYSYLWGNNSEWYNETSLLNNGKPVEFDGYMRVAVDTEVFIRGKTRVETFNNLTMDCKDGINTC
ncbi:hypothetical protein HID58_052771 [Brassica napus]|uniref:O-fucosyltransferase family protein n=1 Tax=Brassica napus TaxID=3708 RepID=A0ABQ8ACU9_BRANA|nr:hypothetical protein HID58_052771 [Brassica napus]